MEKLNLLGEICPIPLLKLKKKLNLISTGYEFMIIIDHSCVFEEIKCFLISQNQNFHIDEVMNGIWEITITKN